MANPGDTGERSLDDVEAELAAARLRLASTVDDLTVAVSPQEIARRQVDRARAWFYTPEGDLRRDRVVKVAGTAVALIAFRMLVRHRSR